MNMKYKKLVVAIQSAMMTSLICSALPSYASDIELYKGPQASQTTLMFMMDVSGSMAFCDNRSSTSEQCQNGDTSRLDYLKQGMVKLLQGSSVDGVEPLADRLVVGLSEFSALTGRIKLEARPLGEESTLSNRPIFQTVQTFTQPASSLVSQSKTTTTTQTKTESGIRLQNCGNNKKTWCDVSTVSNWAVSKDWSPNASSSSGSWTPTAPAWGLTGSKTASGTATPQECIDWNATGTSCTYWESTLKTANDFGSVTSTESSSTPSYSGASSESYSPSSNGTQSGVSYSKETTGTGSCTNNKADCTRTVSRDATIISSRTVSQTSTATFTVTTTYYGTATETHRKKMLRAVKALNATGGTPTAFAYAEVAAYLMGTKTSGSYSGFSANLSNISNSTNYIKPSAYNTKLGQREYTVDSSKSCNTQGIYFLTDGVPEYGGTGRSAAPIMKDSLNGADFSCSSAYLGGKSYYPGSSGNNNTNNWTCIGNYTKRLLNGGTDNPAGVSIRTAVVGFGGIMSASDPSSSFPKYANDIAEAKSWGVLGGGGFYQGSDDNAVVESVGAFLKTLQKYIPPVTTGSVTVPVDNLDTQNVQPWGYFPQFDPQPDSKVNTWIGNLKKYEVVNNVLLDRDGKNVIDATTKISVDDPNDFWADGSIKKTITKIKKVGTADIEEDIQVRVGGALSQFKLGINASNNTERKIYTDRKIDEQTSAASNLSDDSNLVQVKTADLKILNPANNFAKDPKRGYIASLFGYDVGATMANGLETDTSTAVQTNFANYLTNTNATLRQMGAVMHSKPVLITQSGTTSYNDKTGDLTYTDRDDLIVFGSTQGLLHIVRAGKTRTDSDAGKEVFTFMPNEMVDGQYQGFLNQTQQGNTLKYGIDGQWTAYTEYVTKSGTKPTEPVVTVKGGKQWVYGGLRMGGKATML